MKLDPECVRALLLTLEEILCFGDDLEYPTVEFEDVCEQKRMASFKKPQIAYCTLKLIEADFINAAPFDSGDSFCGALYSSITYDGHEFLEGIREHENWKKIKSISGKIGNASLSIIKAISEGVATATLSKYLGLSE